MYISEYLKGGVFFHKESGSVFTKEENKHIADLRGWGNIHALIKIFSEAEAFQDNLGEWIADAINQKLNNPNIPNEEQIASLQTQINALNELNERLKNAILTGDALYLDLKFDDEPLTPRMAYEAQIKILTNKNNELQRALDNWDTQKLNNPTIKTIEQLAEEKHPLISTFKSQYGEQKRERPENIKEYFAFICGAQSQQNEINVLKEKLKIREKQLIATCEVAETLFEIAKKHPEWRAMDSEGIHLAKKLEDIKHLFEKNPLK